jgi:hypothetical protein
MLRVANTCLRGYYALAHRNFRLPAPLRLQPEHGGRARADPISGRADRLAERVWNELSCSVYALNQNLAEFRRYPALVRILQEIGERGLPAIFINGDLLLNGEYPDIARLDNALVKPEN